MQNCLQNKTRKFSAGLCEKNYTEYNIHRAIVDYCRIRHIDFQLGNIWAGWITFKIS